MKARTSPDHQRTPSSPAPRLGKKVPVHSPTAGKSASSSSANEEYKRMDAKVGGSPTKPKEYHYRGVDVAEPADPHIQKAAFSIAREIDMDTDETEHESMTERLTVAGVYREEESQDNLEVDREFAMEQAVDEETISMNHALEIFNEANDDDLELVPGQNKSTHDS